MTLTPEQFKALLQMVESISGRKASPISTSLKSVAHSVDRARALLVEQPAKEIDEASRARLIGNHQPNCSVRTRGNLYACDCSGTKTLPTINRICTSKKSSDGSGSPQIPCDGHVVNGKFYGGCGEPCRWIMQKSGEGEPPW